MNNNIETIIRESGVIEHLNCSVADVLKLHDLYRRGFVTDQMRYLPLDYNFLQTLGAMHGSLSDVRDCFEREVRASNNFRLEVECKKANGTFEKWLLEMETANQVEGSLIAEYLNLIRAQVRPNSGLIRLN